MAKKRGQWVASLNRPMKKRWSRVNKLLKLSNLDNTFLRARVRHLRGRFHHLLHVIENILHSDDPRVGHQQFKMRQIKLADADASSGDDQRVATAEEGPVAQDEKHQLDHM